MSYLYNQSGREENSYNKEKHCKAITGLLTRILHIIFICLIFFTMILVAKAQPGTDKPVISQPIKIVIEQTYEGEKRDILEFNDVKEWVNRVNLTMADLPSGTLRITIKGKAVGKTYRAMGYGPETFRYAGASVEVRFALSDAGGQMLHEIVRSWQVDPPERIRPGYKTPRSAPFEKALPIAFSRGMAYFLVDLLGPDAVIPALHDPDSTIRTFAAFALAESRDSRAFDALVANLKDEKYWKDRSNAAIALGIMGDTMAIEPLFNAFLRDNSGGVQKAAAGALSLIDPYWYYKVPKKHFLEMIVNAFANPSSFTREECLRAINHYDSNWPDSDTAGEAIPELIGYLQNEHFVQRDTVAEGLRRITGEDFGTDYERWLAWYKNKYNK